MSDELKERLRDMAFKWDAEADANADTHPKESRAVASCARELLDALAEHGHPGCCTCCGGGGYDNGCAGMCWDCRGTGHPHELDGGGAS